MKEKFNKNTSIIILVICIMLTIIGVAYSYLAPLISGVETESTISFNSGMIKITYQGSNVITGENIIPGWSETKEFTVVGSNNTFITEEDIMDYQIKLVVEENTFTDGAIRFELTGSSSNEEDTLSLVSDAYGMVPTGAGEVLLGTARFKQDKNIKSDVTHSYSLRIGFPNDLNKNQSDDWGKTFSGYVVIEEGSLTTYNGTDYITSLYSDNEDNISYLRYDETVDNNLRYVGGSTTDVDAVPNYISFNNELWRIIGVFDTYNADTGEKEKSLKIIRSNALGTTSTIDNLNSSTYIGYSWDTSDESINDGYGINEWSQADLMEELNNEYLGNYRENHELWYNGYNNQQTAEYDKSQSIKEEYQQYIMNARLYLGGWDTQYVSAADMYTYERGTAVIPNPLDGVTRTTEWDGKVALMYPSDYGFASTDEECLNHLQDCGNDNNRSNNWIYISKGVAGYDDWWDSNYNYEEWMLSPSSDDWNNNSDGAVFILFFESRVYNYYYSGVSNSYGVRPTLYLTSNTKITGGNGTSSNPYQIKITN